MTTNNPILRPDILQDCLNLTKDTFNTIQSIKQKRKEMDTHTNTQITEEMLDAFFASKHFRFMAGTVDMIKSWEAFKSTHSTVTEERRDGWEILEYIHPHSGTIVSGTYFSGNSIDEDIRKRYLIRSVKRLVDNSILTLGNDTPKGRITKFEYAHPDGKMYIHYDLGGWDYLSQVEKAPIQEKPVLFTTEDGVSVYDIDQDLYWVLTASGWKTECSKLPPNPDNYNKTWKAFSTAAARKEYVLLNKPCLSVNDVEKICDLMYARGSYEQLLNINSLKELAKQRIGGNK